MRKLVVGLTGGVGCGKSTVAAMLQRLGAHVIDVDLAGRWAVEENAGVREQIRSVFGDDVFSAPDQIDRGRLGAIIFADPAAREKLNRIVHPVMLQRVRQLIAEQRESAAPYTYIIVDAALIFELDLDKELDRTVAVSAPLEACIRRIRLRNGLTEKQVRQRMAAQLPVNEKIRRADYVLRNNGDLDTLQGRVNELHNWLMTQAQRTVK